MRRKGPGPFGRGAPKSPHQHHHHGHHQQQQQHAQPHAQPHGGHGAAADAGQYMAADGQPYGAMQRGLADGMNHIAKSIMHSSGRSGIMSVGGGETMPPGGGGGGGYLMDGSGDMVNSSTGELQTPRRENIPMRPLMHNGQQQQQLPPAGYE